MTEREKCDSCGRVLPAESSDAPRERSIFAVSAPKGESAQELVDLLEQISHKWEVAGALAPGEKSWKFRNLHMILYAVATAPPEVSARLMPSETGA